MPAAATPVLTQPRTLAQRIYQPLQVFFASSATLPPSTGAFAPLVPVHVHLPL